MTEAKRSRLCIEHREDVTVYMSSSNCFFKQCFGNAYQEYCTQLELF